MIDLGKMRAAFGPPTVQISPAATVLLETWQGLPAVEENKSHYFVRYVSVDVATAGLRPGLDALLGIAAVGIRQGVVGAADVCADDLPADADADAATSQTDVGAHLAAFLNFLGKGPLVTFQAAFVDAFLRRAFAHHLGVDFSPQWIDLAWVLPEFFGQVAGNASLDDWLKHFAIQLPGRREALSDSVAVARLLLAAQAEATRRGIDTPKKLREIENTRRWLGRR